MKSSRKTQCANEAIDQANPTTTPSLIEITDVPRQTILLTNHFKYVLKEKESFEYKITDIGNKDRRKTKEIYEQTIEQWPSMKCNGNDFATNHYNAIVSWKNLQQTVDKPCYKDDGASAGLWKMTLTNDDSPANHDFELVQKIDTDAIE